MHGTTSQAYVWCIFHASGRRKPVAVTCSHTHNSPVGTIEALQAEFLPPHEKLRLTPSKTRIPIGLAGERQIPNCGQMAQKSSQTAQQQDQTDYVRDV